MYTTIADDGGSVLVQRAAGGAVAVDVLLTIIEWANHCVVATASTHPVQPSIDTTTDPFSVSHPNATAFVAQVLSNDDAFAPSSAAACRYSDDRGFFCAARGVGSKSTVVQLTFSSDVASVTHLNGLQAADDGKYPLPDGPVPVGRTIALLSHWQADVPDGWSMSDVFVTPHLRYADLSNVHLARTHDQVVGNVTVYGQLVTFSEAACVVTHHDRVYLTGTSSQVKVQLPRAVPRSSSIVMPSVQQSHLGSACSEDDPQLSAQCLVTLEFADCVTSSIWGEQACTSVLARRPGADALTLPTGSSPPSATTTITPFQIVVFGVCDPDFFRGLSSPAGAPPTTTALATTPPPSPAPTQPLANVTDAATQVDEPQVASDSGRAVLVAIGVTIGMLFLAALVKVLLLRGQHGEGAAAANHLEGGS